MDRNIQFPDPNKTDDEGLVAVGGELSADFLVAAYAQGVFPWFNEGDPLMWFSPNPRMVLLTKDFKVSKSLRQLIRSDKFELRIDTCFNKVIAQCSNIKREGQDGTWITEDMERAYNELHDLGITHSFETYMNGELVGGLYGVSLGKAFFGESMFFKEANASKFAFYYLVEWCKQHDFHFIDAQQSTSHMKSLGAKDIPRKEFLEMLQKALQHNTHQGRWKNANSM